MKRILLLLLFLCCLVLPLLGQAQEVSTSSQEMTAPPVEQIIYYKAKVTGIVKETEEVDPLTPGGGQFTQTVTVQPLEGPKKNQSVTADFIAGASKASSSKLKVNDVVFITSTGEGADLHYYVTDHYRLPSVIILLGIFILLTIVFAGWQGIRSLLGLGFTIATIMVYVLPQIIAGHNPFLVSLIGSLIIAVVSLYLAHGFKKRTSIALLATLITITLAIGAAVASVQFTQLFGLGSEDALYIQISDLAQINLRGLLLGGIIIGVLGVLDDITTAQVAAVEEISKANQRLTFKQLYDHGQSVGREHIASLVNTLALAYVGASFPLLLLFIHYPQPLMITLNSETIVEEVVRTLIGSAALIVAVPIATALGAYFFGNRSVSENKS